MVEDNDNTNTSTPITQPITQPMSITVIPVEQTNDYMKIIEGLYTKYKNYPYVLHRLNIHIENLPATLEQEAENYEKRQNRNALLNNEQKTFIQVFLKKHQYFYHATNNTFFEYDNKHYSKIKEDDILYNLLTGISKDDILIQWKYKTKANVIKIIKERNLLKSIPETYTIQRVLKFLSPAIFKTKNETKYFLTILGDNILKKKNSNIYLTNSSTKKLLNEIDNLASIFLGLNNVNGNFITKYHENNDYENYRLINTVDAISVEFIQEIVRKLGLDLLCVGSHYSTRFTNSDNFLETKIEDELKNRVLFLKMNTPKTIIDAFCDQYIERLPKMGGAGSDCTMTSTSTTTTITDNTYHIKKMNYSITWKNMHFIWKKFLSNMGMPNIIFYNTIKNILKERFEYDEHNDTFYDVTSKYLPVVSEFIRFWDDTITYDIEFNDLTVAVTDGNGNGNGSLQVASSPLCSPTDYYLLNTYNPVTPTTPGDTNEFTNELEIGEILSLFKYWCKTNNSDIPTTIMSLSTFYENEIIKLLRHFYPNIKILDNKFIPNIQCILWNKNKDIDNSLEQLKTTYKKQNKDVIIDFSDAYYFYAVYVSKLNNGKSKANVEINDGDAELEFTMDNDDGPETLQESEHINIKHIVVNKRYFEEYLKFSLSNYIVFDNFISTEWYSEN